jgi:hypothetical protein
MAKRTRESAGLILERGPRGVGPASAFDAEQLDRFPIGTQFRATSLTKRSLPHHRLYWGVLSRVVSATERWPTPEHLHQLLMEDLGYVTVIHDLKGRPKVVRDSEAFDAMKQHEFNDYFEKAMMRLAESIGVDPLELANEAKAAA